jgi:hypothetical protein
MYCMFQDNSRLMIFHARTSTLMCHCFPQAHSCSAPFPSVQLFVGSYSSARYATCLLPNTYGTGVEAICCGFLSVIFFLSVGRPHLQQMAPRKVALGAEKVMIDVKSPLASLSILPADDGEMAPLCTSGRLRLS